MYVASYLREKLTKPFGGMGPVDVPETLPPTQMPDKPSRPSPTVKVAWSFHPDAHWIERVRDSF